MESQTVIHLGSLVEMCNDGHDMYSARVAWTIQGNWNAYKEDAPKRGCREKHSPHLKYALSEFQETGTCFKEIWACFQKQDPFIVWGESHRRLRDAGWDLLWIPWFSNLKLKVKFRPCQLLEPWQEVKGFYKSLKNVAIAWWLQLYNINNGNWVG